jgi:hypothetical protein
MEWVGALSVVSPGVLFKCSINSLVCQTITSGRRGQGLGQESDAQNYNTRKIRACQPGGAVKARSLDPEATTVSKAATAVKPVQIVTGEGSFAQGQ